MVRSYYGIVRSAGSYTFDNVNYIGAELIYTDPGYTRQLTLMVMLLLIQWVHIPLH